MTNPTVMLYNLDMSIRYQATVRFVKVIQKLGYPNTASLAREMGLSRQRLSQAILMPERARSLRGRIARFLGLSYDETWGEPEPPIKQRVSPAVRHDTLAFLKYAQKAEYPTVADVARAAGMRPGILLQLIYGESKNKNKREKIASLLGVSYNELWDKNGVRIP